MPRKKSSVWLRGFDLLSSALGVRPVKPPKAAKSGLKKRGTKAAATSVLKPVIKPAAKRQPAVKRMAARATPSGVPGKWVRSFHSAPPLPGHLVNHLAYELYLPASYSPRAGLPLVVMLHGCKQTAASFAAGTRICKLAERAGFAVLLPEQAKTANAQRCWHWHGDAAQTEAPAVASLVAALVREYGFDDARVYLAGMSAGAGLAAQLAIRHPRLFAAVGLHSGPVFGAATSTMSAMSVMRRGSREEPAQLIDGTVDVQTYPGMPAMIVHGEIDAVVARRNALQLGVEFARVNRLVDAQGVLRVGEERAFERDGADYVDYLKGGRLIVRVCVIRGLGHAWSGGDPREAFHSGRGPESTAMLWQFFRRQKRTA
ncbi:PHB depolymerase family esterase [Paraburkholderia sp. J94]|uniref:extracellular catalytic domain type 1 short-chain-length polyhydroxyalkanoate depolymerase n=1 Tax=Paraburkholderia sp. J94 TaxID=2805441 RepID=UPI002AB265B3|nr:PHB depolymerase family esterase [Paraburkholderia sp. J94]